MNTSYELLMNSKNKIKSMCAKIHGIIWSYDKTMNMQCLKQTSTKLVWFRSRNLNHTKIVQQCMTTLVNAPKLVHLYPFKLPKLKSILWYFLFTQNGIDEANMFFLVYVWQIRCRVGLKHLDKHMHLSSWR
jgi:hypothetical protein